MKFNVPLDELAADESFQNWVLGKGDPKEHASWDQWLLENPSKENSVKKAALVITNLSQNNEHLAAEVISAEWRKLQSSLNREQVKSRWMGTTVLKYAASVALLIAVGVGSYFQFFKIEPPKEFVTYHSEFGEKLKVNLPDGSIVLLNANTTLKTYANWDDESREVWLESGEAYFSIAKQQDKSNFLVYTDGLNVEVMGTQFNVNLVDGVSVLLNEGSIKLLQKEGEDLFLKPGDLAQYRPGEKILISRSDLPRRYTSWLDNKIVFDNTSLSEIALYVKRHYGATLSIPDTTLQKRRLSGEIPNDNLDLLLNAISATMDLSIKEVNGKFLIENDK